MESKGGESASFFFLFIRAKAHKDYKQLPLLLKAILRYGSSCKLKEGLELCVCWGGTFDKFKIRVKKKTRQKQILTSRFIV